MPLSTGERLRPYSISALIGGGGIGVAKKITSRRPKS
jgi:hypothetical protein